MTQYGVEISFMSQHTEQEYTLKGLYFFHVGEEERYICLN